MIESGEEDKMKMKRITCLILTLILLLTLCSCGPKKEKVITNDPSVETPSEDMGNDLEEPVLPDVGEGVTEEASAEETEDASGEDHSEVSEETVEESKEAPLSEDEPSEEEQADENVEEELPEEEQNTGDEPVEGESTGEEQTSENEEGDTGYLDDDIVVIEGVTYKGYKGPVQGEIKYCEGTPATENSGDYKASGDIESPYNIELIVTADFGHSSIYAENVGLVKDEVGMEVLFRNLDIITAYGGGFVNSINGIESHYTFYTGSERKKLDWFYFVNGVLANVGVAEYVPHDGDEIWWDYHNWGTTMFISSVIGAYPQPFLSGYNDYNPGTVILYTEKYEDEAAELKASLLEKGVLQIDVAEYSPEIMSSEKKYYILIGAWNDLSLDNELITEANRKSKFVGVHAEFEDGLMNATNFKGKTVKSYEKNAGAIYSISSEWGLYPVWLVTGIDDVGVEMAHDVLINNPESIKQFYGAVVSEDGIQNIPYPN